MFTVMHGKDGTEMLYACAQVEYLPAHPSGNAGPTVHCLVGPHEAGSGMFAGTLFDGEVSVMNEKGVEVARYSLHQAVALCHE